MLLGGTALFTLASLGSALAPAALLGLAAVTALVLLRGDGRGERVNVVELQAG